jgi:hypothetical protein
MAAWDGSHLDSDVLRAEPAQILANNVHCKLKVLIATGKRTQSIIQFQAHAIAEDAQAQLQAVRLKNRNTR